MTVRGIDRAQRVLHAVGMDDPGQSVLHTRVSRHARMPLLAQLPPGRLGRAAGGGAHDWARRFREPGHAVTRMAPPGVTPYVKSHKTDRRDAEAIAEAVPRPTRRLVPTQDVDQQALQALQRGRERRRGERTARVHAGHGLRRA
jgi:transposase